MARPLVSFAAAFALLSVGLALGTSGCTSGAPESAVQTGIRNLRCSRSELQTTLSRDTGVVREYYVGCNFMYTRVLCQGDRCYPAKAEPPCMPKMSCFKEDPKTLEWILDDERAPVAIGDDRH
jgi:hypothetical protein